MIGPRTNIGERPHWVSFENPGDPVPTPGGGFTDGAPVLIGSAFVRIQPASASDQERVIAGTVLSRQSHIVTAPWLSGLTNRTVMRFYDARVTRERRYAVMGVSDADERGAELMLVCDEVVQ